MSIDASDGSLARRVLRDDGSGVGRSVALPLAVLLLLLSGVTIVGMTLDERFLRRRVGTDDDGVD